MVFHNGSNELTSDLRNWNNRGLYIERATMSNKFEYDGIIHETPDNGGAYVIFPWDIREVFGKGRVKVHARFDGISYDGSIVNMGIKDSHGNTCYVIGVLKSIREKLKKNDGDSVHIVIEERL